jgi:hypothetical protein
MSWQQLAELASREDRLVEVEDWDALLALQDERERLIASLPSPPPLHALPMLATARDRLRATEDALRRALGANARQLDELRRGRRALAAYGGGSRHALDARA